MPDEDEHANENDQEAEYKPWSQTSRRFGYSGGVRWRCVWRIFGHLRRPTEGFYDTALNEASECELDEIVPTPTRVAKRGRCAEGLSVKTMLGDRRDELPADHRQQLEYKIV